MSIVLILEALWKIFQMQSIDTTLIIHVGGLYDESVDVEGTRKRKRPLYCFACRDKLKHPTGGFSGGHGLSSTY